MYIFFSRRVSFLLPMFSFRSKQHQKLPNASDLALDRPYPAFSMRRNPQWVNNLFTFMKGALLIFIITAGLPVFRQDPIFFPKSANALSPVMAPARPFSVGCWIGGYTSGHAPNAKRDSADKFGGKRWPTATGWLTCTQVVYESFFSTTEGWKYASWLGCVILQVKEEKAVALRWTTLKT